VIKRFTRPFRQLRWKLTLSYTVTSVVAFLLVEALIIGFVLTFLATNISTILLGNLSQQAPQAAPYLARAARDPEPLTTWLQIAASNVGGQQTAHMQVVFMAVTDKQGQVVASTGSQALAARTPLETVLMPQNSAKLHAVLNDPTGKTSAVGDDTGNMLVAIVPIQEGGSVQGALVLKTPRPDWLQTVFRGVLGVVLASAIFITILTGIIGTVFGYIFARGMTRRLKRLSIVVNRWGRGDFAARAVDKSRDEVASITDQLNHMAEQLQSLIQTRQELATLEERNRLARDLHDSIKQQIFAVSMQVGSIKLLLRRDVDAAEARLNKMETLVREAQQELTSLIRELRPVALEGKGLVEALRELIPQWSQQSDIVANLRVDGAQTLPLVVEEALLRVVQEALSNIARHSKATLVQITLAFTDERVTLSILDNGQGFDPAQLEHRGVGLLSMQERMKALGGDMKLESAPGKGTCITAFCNRLGVGVSDGMDVETSLEGIRKL
jgi:signal transduction histidine kinase